jgi:hypothetical protein
MLYLTPNPPKVEISEGIEAKVIGIPPVKSALNLVFCPKVLRAKNRNEYSEEIRYFIILPRYNKFTKIRQN